MSWPVTLETLESIGQQSVADSAGAIAGYSTAFGELTLTAPATGLVAALTLLRDRDRKSTRLNSSHQ